MTEISRETIDRVVRDSIRAVLPSVPADAISGDKHLRDLGADSVDRVEIILMIIERLQIDEPMSSFSQLPNVASLTDFLCERCR